MMKKTYLLCLVFISLLTVTAYSKRVAPAEVKPVAYENIQYEAPVSRMGYIEAYDLSSGKKLWEKQVYVVKYKPFLERDAQDIYIKDLKIQVSKVGVFLEVTDERERKYNIRVKERYEPIVTEIIMDLSVDEEGGIYTCSMFNDKEFLPAGGYRYSEYIPAWLSRSDLKKLILVSQEKFVSTTAFEEEFLILLKQARENQKIVEVRRPCSEWKCQAGYISVIYDYQDKEMDINCTKDSYLPGEKVPFTISNRAGFEKDTRNISVEKELQGRWVKADTDANCPCLAKCDYSMRILTGQTIDQTWDARVYDKECKMAESGRYRFVISLSGWKDKNMCERYDSFAYSKVFEIREAAGMN